MKILLLDDEPLALEDLESNVKEAIPEADICAFTSWQKALEKAKEQIYDVAFLDIQMPCGMNGLEVSKQLKDIQKDINIIFVTAHAQYALDAYKLHASGYIVKPSTCKAIQDEINNLRKPVEYSKKKLEVHCFGNFDLYMEGNIVNFGRSKAKELFAYLIDRNGAAVTLEEACSILWEGADNTSANKDYFRKLIADLRDTLKSIHMQDVLIHTRNAYSIDTKLVDCDYYRFLNGEAAAVNQYQGEYMNQYSWAEMSVGKI